MPLPPSAATTLVTVAADQDLLEIGRKAIEDTLIEFRDCRLSELGRANGCVVSEKDGRASGVIRLGPEDALRIGLRAIADHIDGRAAAKPVT